MGKREEGSYPKFISIHQVAFHVFDDVRMLARLHDPNLCDEQLGVLRGDLHLLDCYLGLLLQVRCQEDFSCSTKE